MAALSDEHLVPAPLVILGQYLLALPVYAALRAGRRWGWVAFAVLTPVLLGMPLLVDPDQRVWRFVAATLAAAVFFKELDLLVQRAPAPNWRAFLGYLSNPSTLVLRQLAHEPVVPKRQSAKRLGRGIVVLLVGAAAFVGATRLGLSGPWFIVDHTTRVVTLFVAVTGILDIVASALRLLFFDRVREPMGAFFWAPTPAEFWRRYNRMVGQAFHENIFRRLGGLRRPVTATLAVFVASSILHEYVFGIPIGRVQGYQTAFFMLQGIAVAATVRVRPRGAWRPVWIGGTLAFNAASSILFFVSVEQVTPFWSLQLP